MLTLDDAGRLKYSKGGKTIGNPVNFRELVISNPDLHTTIIGEEAGNVVIKEHGIVLSPVLIVHQRHTNKNFDDDKMSVVIQPSDDNGFEMSWDCRCKSESDFRRILSFITGDSIIPRDLKLDDLIPKMKDVFKADLQDVLKQGITVKPCSLASNVDVNRDIRIDSQDLLRMKHKLTLRRKDFEKAFDYCYDSESSKASNQTDEYLPEFNFRDLLCEAEIRQKSISLTVESFSADFDFGFKLKMLSIYSSRLIDESEIKGKNIIIVCDDRHFNGVTINWECGADLADIRRFSREMHLREKIPKSCDWNLTCATWVMRMQGSISMLCENFLSFVAKGKNNNWKCRIDREDMARMQHVVRFDKLREQYIKVYNSDNGIKDEGCFITTAVCSNFGKPDDCYELETFRNFRDNWLANQIDGSKLIEEYYRIAPDIVRKINSLPNASKIYQSILEKYLASCLQFIESGDNFSCRDKYIEMVNSLKKKFLS